MIPNEVPLSPAENNLVNIKFVLENFPHIEIRRLQKSQFSLPIFSIIKSGTKALTPTPYLKLNS